MREKQQAPPVPLLNSVKMAIEFARSLDVLRGFDWVIDHEDDGTMTAWKKKGIEPGPDMIIEVKSLRGIDQVIRAAKQEETRGLELKLRRWASLASEADVEDYVKKGAVYMSRNGSEALLNWPKDDAEGLIRLMMEVLKESRPKLWARLEPFVAQRLGSTTAGRTPGR